MEDLKSFEESCNWANSVDPINVETTICLSWKSFGYLIIGLVGAFLLLSLLIIYLFNNNSSLSSSNQQRTQQYYNVLGYDPNQPVYANANVVSN